MTTAEKITVCPIHYDEWNDEPTVYHTSCSGCREALALSSEHDPCPVHYTEWNDEPTAYHMSCPDCRKSTEQQTPK